MVLGSLSCSERYEQLHPLLGTLFEFLRTNDLMSLPEGRIELKGERLFLNVVECDLTKPEGKHLEAHRAYLDVHIPLSQSETIGWHALEKLGVPTNPFDEENDFATYDTPASTYIVVQPYEFLILYPEDAHVPLIGEGKIRKIVAKVLV